tara:strand:- start:1228 stop:1434 length:207 start_codon:yes stop_codon:yes gene_type:complete
MAEFEHLYELLDVLFEELESLRLSGVINMNGAPRWLEQTYGLSSAEAKFVFTAWVEFKREEKEKLLMC